MKFAWTLPIPFTFLSGTPVAAGDGMHEQRQRMVEEQLVRRGITHPQVLAAMAAISREEFVPGDQRADAYTDQPLPIGAGQTISQPYIVAYMTEQLAPQPSDRVLEIGTGCGYQAAVLSRLVKEIYSVEIVESLGRRAAKDLARLGCANVHSRIGDGYAGWLEAAPFDAIIVTCAPDHIPEPLVEQLKDEGRMIIPVGGRSSQDLYLLEKRAGQMKQKAILPVRFVPMTGRATPGD